MRDFLRKIPLLADLSESDLELLSQLAEVIQLKTGDLLFAEGSASDRAYIIKEGQLDIIKASATGDMLLAVREPGEVIGEISLLDDAPRLASVVARTDSVLLAISREQFDHLLETSPAASRAILRILLPRWRTTEAALQTAQTELAQRLAESRQRTAELTTVNIISQALNAELEFNSLLDLIGEQMRQTFAADIVYLALYDPQTNMIHFPYDYEGGQRLVGESIYFGQGLTSKIIESGQPLLINHNFEQHRNGLGAEQIGSQAKSFLGVPIQLGQQSIGVISVQSTKQEGRFNDNDVRLLSTIAANVGAAIQNARLFEAIQQAKRGLERELEIGREIQAGFLPEQLPQLPGWEIAARFQAAREVAGDFYDAFPLAGGDRVVLVLGDVCGKGVGAALFMTLFRSLIRASAHLIYSTGQPEGAAGPFDDASTLKNMVTLTNNYVARTHYRASMFASLFLGVLNPVTGSLIYLNGGHESPEILGSEGVKAALTPTGPVVGLFADMDFKIQQVYLEPGDTLYAFTDGVIDAQNSAGEMFGRENLRSLLAQPVASAAALLDLIETTLNIHVAGANQYDDITMLAVQRK
ncbi:MAG: hypothetical protein DPW09_14010 [Anaerolineae bacterium]|nr:hypothetical protein [Anaerolineae bacterium]